MLREFEMKALREVMKGDDSRALYLALRRTPPPYDRMRGRQTTV